MTINNPLIFFGAAGALFAYLIYTMIRTRKGARPGSKENEVDL